jgi:REP element-mobilizing transposase RayT
VERDKPHSHNLRLNRLADAPATFFVTKSVQPKGAMLDRKARQVVAGALCFAAKEERIDLRAFVVMPDHWHALLALRGDWKLPRLMHSVMSFVGKETHSCLKRSGAKWQEGYYDTRIRTARQFHYVQNYIERNPVTNGLVEDPDQWESSSACDGEFITKEWPWFFTEESRR